MTGAGDLARLVPGFEFMQGLFKGAGAALPGVGQWVAPTLDPAELEKKIKDLRTVQFWLEQNAKLLGVTIQALEVQRMTLSTLQTMNLPLADLGEALKIKAPAAATPGDARPAPAPAAAPKADAAPSPAPAAAPASPAAAAGAPTSVVDPMQWWSALTQQFTEIAGRALADRATPLSATTPKAASTKAGGPARAVKTAKAAATGGARTPGTTRSTRATPRKRSG